MPRMEPRLRPLLRLRSLAARAALSTLSAVAVSLLAFASAAWAGSTAAEPAAPLCPQGHGPVAQAGLVPIGGIRQWVTIDGADCANPVLLIVHGGPGNPNTPFARRLFGSWTSTFTVVQWDQRGAGKTYEASPPAEDDALTMEQLTQDGVAVARHVTQQLGHRQVILMGGSWGSALAVHMAMAAPSLFHAYVGTSQLVNYPADVAAAYALTLSRARASGDAASISTLEALGAPPWTNPRAFGILRRVTRHYETLRTETAPRDWFAFGPGYDTPAYAAAHEAGEDYSFLQFVGLRGNGMASRIDLRQLGLRFAMPVYLLQGEEDLVTPMVVSQAYFNELVAPHKEFLPLPRTGHDPNRRMLEAQFTVLQRVRADWQAATAP